MSTQGSNGINTPRNQKGRALGLRRSFRHNQKGNLESNKSLTPIPTIPQAKFNTPKNSMELASVSSASCSKPTSNLHSTPQTPCFENALERLAHSTNGRPYRLTLNKRMREKFTKKRLEFDSVQCGSATAEVSKTINETPTTSNKDSNAESVSQSEQDIRSKIAAMSKEEIIEELKKHPKEVDSYLRHAEKVKELEELIETWKKAFRISFNDLHDKIEPKLEKVELLKRLQIPADMLPYVDDDDEDFD